MAAFNGTTGPDDLLGGADNDTLTGLAGDDTMEGGEGNDSLNGGEGNDSLLGSGGRDTLDGGNGNDSLYGGKGTDILQGGAGNDYLDGGAGRDTLIGGAGDDVLYGGVDDDVMSGGAGADTYLVDNVLDEVYESDTIAGDHVLTWVDYTMPQNVEMMTLAAGAGGISGFGNLQANTLSGNEGDNLLDGAAGNDSISGGEGNDLIKGGAGRDTLTGNDGSDTFKWRTNAETTSLTSTPSVLATLIANSDVVTDFTPGVDKIDVSMIDGNAAMAGYQPFQFITGSVFTAAGQVRFDSATQSLLFNTNSGLTTVEYAIKLAGVGSVSASDLILADTVAPTITTPAETLLAENSGRDQIVFRAAVDEGTATYSLVGGNVGRFTLTASTGFITLNPNPDFESRESYTVTLRATDPAGNITDKVLTVYIQNLDEVPPTIISPTTGNANENQNVLYDADADDSADISAGVTWTITGTHASLLNIDASTGVVTRKVVNLDFETQSSYSFTVVASDGVNAAVSKGVTITVNNLDEVAPNFTSPTTASVDENVAVGTTVYTPVTNDDGDIDSGDATFTLKDTLDGASFTIDGATGAVKTAFAVDHETQSSYQVVIVATDPAGNAREHTVTITVNDLDEAPPDITSLATADIDENAGAGQVVYTVTSTDTGDVSSGPTTYSLKPDVGDEDAFTIDEDTGQVTLTADPDAEEQDSYTFTVVASDPAGNESELEVTLTVNDLDEVAPGFTSGNVATAIDENTHEDEVVYTAAATDPTEDGPSDPITYSLKDEGDAASFSIDDETGEVTLLDNPDADTKDSYTFTVIAADAAGNETEQVVTLAINDLDEVAPGFSSGNVATAIDENTHEDEAVYTAAATDPTDDGPSDPVTYSLKDEGDYLSFSIDEETGQVTLLDNPDADTKDSYSFTVIASDAAGNEVEQTVTLAVYDLDDADPVVTSGATADAIDEETGANQVVYTAEATDDGDDVSGGVTFSLAEAGDWEHFDIDDITGQVTLLDDPDFETQDEYTFTVVATDAAGNSDSEVVTLTINDVVEVGPVFTSGATADAIDENSGAGQSIYTAAATGVDVAYAIKADSGDDDFVTIDSETGVVTLTPNPDHEGKSSYTFTVQATDVTGTSEKTVTLQINDLDEVEPEFSGGATTTATAIDENTGEDTIVYTASATDPAEDTGPSNPIVYELDSSGDWLKFSLDADTGALKLLYMTDHETQSSYTVTIKATDAAGNTATQTVTLPINDVDEAAPEITSPTTADIDEVAEISLFAVGHVVYTAQADDTDDVSDGVTFSLAETDDWEDFSIDEDTGVVTLLGDPDHETKASYTFTVIATDGAGLTDSQTVTLTVNDLDEVAPAITSDATADAIDENTGGVVYTAEATDSGDISAGVTFSLEESGDYDDFDIDDVTGQVTLLADADYEDKTSYTFTVIATDGAGLTDSKTVTLAVNNLDEVQPDITSPATDDADEKQNVLYTATADDSDDYSEGVGWALTGTDAALLSIDENGVVTLDDGNLDHESKSSYSFNVVATDGATDPVVMAVTITVNDLNEAPTGVDLEDEVTTLPENTDTTERIAVATILVADDDLGTETITLSGDDAASFEVDGNVLYLRAGETLDFETKSSYSVTVEVEDESLTMTPVTTGYTLTLTNVDEPATFSGQDSGTVSEGSSTPATGDLDASDVDSATTFIVQTDQDSANGYGTFSIDADGNWSYTLDSGLDTMVGGETYSDSFVVESADGTDKTVNITINGTDDPTVFSGNVTIAFDETDSAETVSGTVVATDPDSATAFVPQTNVQGDFETGSFSIDAAGNWSFTMNEAYNDFVKNVTYSDTIQVATTSGATQTLTVNIKGTNDNPTALNLSGASIAENNSAGATIGTLSTVDPESSSGFTYTLVSGDGDTDNAAFTIAGNQLQIVGVGDFEDQDSFSVRIRTTDPHGGTFEAIKTITLTDVNEAPTAVALGGGAVTSMAENTDTTARIKVADIVVSDDALGSATLSVTGDDALSFELDGTELFLKAGVTLNHEGQASYSITIEADDTSLVADPVTVDYTLTLTDVDESQPTITSLATGSANENQATLYDANATDLGDVSGGLTWSLADGVGDEDLLIIHPTNGMVSLFSGNLNEEAKASYTFTVVVSDGVTTPVSQSVTITVNDLDESAPTITSGSTATAINENSGAGQMIYDANATDSGDISGGVTFSLKAVNDHASFTIDGPSGQVTLTGNPDFETKSSYNFTVVATDAAGNFTEQAVSLAINDVAEAGPVISGLSVSGTTISFTATGSGTLSLVAPFATPFSNPTITTGVQVNLTATQQASAVSGTLQVTNGNPSDVVGLYLGTSAGDTITAPLAGSANVLYGFGGNDTISGGSAADTIQGGAGADVIDLSGGGSDRIVLGGTTTDTGIDAISNFTAGSGTGFDKFLFSTVNTDVTLDGSGFASVADLSSVSGATFIVLTENVGRVAASNLKSALDAGNYDSTTTVGDRVMVWQMTTTTVGVARINNTTTASSGGNNDVTVTHLATITVGSAQTFLAGLTADNFGITV